MIAKLKPVLLAWGWMYLGVALLNSISDLWFERMISNEWVVYGMTLLVAIAIVSQRSRGNPQPPRN